jgi:ribonuclease G
MKKIIINSEPWETRIAILQKDELLQNLYFASHTTQQLERSYFKGTVIKVLPGIQTAFVDIGQEKAGFLHISEVDRSLALKRMAQSESPEDSDDVVEDDEENKEPLLCELNMDKIFHEGEHVLVQVSKEPVYEKGPKLTTCFTIPGRFLVLMPNIPRVGVSKKIEDPEERLRLRKIVRDILPKAMGAIIRTPSEGRSEQELIYEIKYLVSIWETIQQKFKDSQPKELIYQDIDLTHQIVRDNLDSDVEAVVCDDKAVHSALYKFAKQIAPELAMKIMLFDQKSNVFDYYSVSEQIAKALEKKVFLKSGGSLIIETTEAMTVIDVNTGKYIGSKNLEDTLFYTNMEAAEEVVRQLRLRNIGGLIVIDFIDMTSSNHRQQLFKSLERFLKERDKFQSVVLRVSEFGLVQMTRKRTGKTLAQQMMIDCLCCKGRGLVLSVKTESYAFLRTLKIGCIQNKYGSVINASVHKDVFHYVVASEYNALLNFEKEFGKKIILSAHQDGFAMNKFIIS